MYENNTIFFSFGKSSVVTGIINQLIQNNCLRMRIQMRKLQHVYFRKIISATGSYQLDYVQPLFALFTLSKYYSVVLTKRLDK